MNKYTLSFLLFLFLQGNLFSQVNIKGMITEDNGKPLPYASVYLKKNKLGVSSNIKGEYSLFVKEIRYQYDTLVFSYLGFKTKTIPLSLRRGRKLLNVRMNKDAFILKDVLVSAPKSKYTALQIIKKAKRRIRKNYSNTKKRYYGFSRDLLKRNGIAEELNECFFTYEASKYPQKRYSGKSFHQFWKDVYKLEMGSGHKYVLFYPTFITRKDSVFAEQVRVSYPNRVNEKRTFLAPQGGPIDLISLDNVKYMSHFLYPKLFKKYTYKIVDETIINEDTCWVIKYAPSKKRTSYLWHPLNKKMKEALLFGDIFISKKSFAVLKFTACIDNWEQVRSDIVLLPSQTYFELNYKKEDGRYALHKIDCSIYFVGSQRFLDNNRIYKKDTDMVFNWQQSLVLTSDTTYNKWSRKEDYFPISPFRIRNYSSGYDSSFWNEFEAKDLFVNLGREEKEQLESSVALPVQYAYLNKEVTEFKTPESTPFFEGTQISDSSKYKQYIKDENTYCSVILQKISTHQKKYLRANVLKYKWDEDKKKLPKSFIEVDSVSRQLFYYEIDSSKLAYKKMINLSQEYRLYPKSTISDFFSTQDKIFMPIDFNEQIGDKIKVFDKASLQPIDSMTHVNEYLMLNDEYLVYTLLDDYKRASKLYLYCLKDQTHRLLLDEKDLEYDFELSRSSSERYIIVDVTSKDQNEIWLIDSKSQEIRKVHSRQEGVQVQMNHFYDDDYFVALIADKDYSIVKKDSKTLRSEPLIKSEKIIYDFYLYKNNLLYTEYNLFDMELKKYDLNKKINHKINTIKDIKFIEFLSKKEKDSVLFSVESKINPRLTYKLSLEDNKMRLIDQEVYSYPFRKRQFKTKLVYADSKDGKKIPILLSYSKKHLKDSTLALQLKAYGAYGSLPKSMFSEDDIVLLDRGFIIAQVAVRGSAVLGKDWYKDGKLLNKKHSFEDFIAASRFLKSKYNIPSQRTFAKGVSAGGLIMGVMVNQYASDFGGIILDRAFLNVYESMQNPKKFLTTSEYQEWGNASQSSFSDYIRSYSPLHNIPSKIDCHLFVRASYFDAITPTKDIAYSVIEYRKRLADKKVLLFKTNMRDKHMIRYSSKRLAEEYAFMKYVMEKGL